MALKTDALKTAIKQAYQNDVVRGSDPEASADKLAELISSAIEAFVKSGEVKFTPGKITGNTVDPQSGTPVPLAAGAGTGGAID